MVETREGGDRISISHFMKLNSEAEFNSKRFKQEVAHHGKVKILQNREEEEEEERRNDLGERD